MASVVPAAQAANAISDTAAVHAADVEAQQSHPSPTSTTTAAPASDSRAENSQTSESSTPWTEEWLSGPSSHQFYTRIYTVSPSTPLKGTILFIHGFAEHIGRYEHVHVRYPSKGYNVVAFDQRGFGRTALDEKRSKGSAYGKTSWKLALEDVEWFVGVVKARFGSAPIFLMGHSMGGGLALAFPTRTSAPPNPEIVKLLDGVIASSPLIQLTTPQPKFLRWTGGKLSMLLPSLPFPADVPAEHLSRNPAANEANLKDPLIKRLGTLKGLDDMLSGGDRLIENDWQHWPKELPVLFVQGTDDKVTSYKATQEFFRKIPAEDKRLSLYEGGYHELVHDIDGLPERLFEEVVSWIDSHLSVRSKL